MKRFAWLMLAFVLLSSCAGKDSSMGLSNVKATEKVDEHEKSIWVEGDGYPMVIHDFLKTETTLEKKFKRPAVLSATPMNIWYDLGGKSVCTSDLSNNVRLVKEYDQEMRALPTVGPVYSINMESVISHEPDFIIAQIGTQSTPAKKLREMGYPVVLTHIRGFEDVCSTYEAFGKILGQEKLAASRIEHLRTRKEELAAKAPKEGKSVIILYISGNTIAAKLDNSIAGDIASTLGLKNIASNLPPDKIGSEHTPLDVEYIVEHNPDVILVTSMVASNELAREAMEKEFNSNPIWKGVSAIDKGNVFYLPQEYFLFNAGPYYDDAIEYMARSVYPEIYGKVEDLDGL